MKNKIFLIAMLMVSSRAWAQQESDLTLSVREALDLGLKNRYDVKANQYNILTAETKVTEEKQTWIPDLDATGNIRYNAQIQSTYVPGGFFTSEPSLVTLGARNASVFGLELNQVLFKPTLASDVKLAQNNLQLEKEKVRAQENIVRQHIAIAYFNALLKQLQNKISGDNEQRNKEYMQVAKAKMDAGALIENDYLKAQLDYENAKIEAERSQQNYDLAIDNIKYQVNVPVGTHIALTDSITSKIDPSILINQGDGNRTEIRQLNLQQKSNELELSKSKRTALPTVSLYANYSQQFTYNDFNYGLSQWWSPFSYVGVRFTIPISHNLKNTTSIRERQHIMTQTDLNLKQKQADVDYETRKTASELDDAEKNMQTAKSNYDLSRIIYQNQKKQYDLGSLLYSSLLDTDKSLRTTEQNYVQSVYNYLLALINYQIAIGNL